jgi:hypothetical protein
VVRNAARPLTRQKQVQIAETMLRQFHELLRLKSIQVDEIKSEPFLHFMAKHESKTYRLAFMEILSGAAPECESGVETVIWCFEKACSPQGVGFTVVSLLEKTLEGPSGIFVDSAREFLRKRGIRLHPGPWRYQKGLI